MKRASKLKRRRRANDRPQQQLLRPQSNLELTPPTAAYQLASAISAAPTSSSIADAVTAPMDSTRTFFGDGNTAASTSINLHLAPPDSGSPSAGSRSNHYDGNGRCWQGVGLGPYAARWQMITISGRRLEAAYINAQDWLGTCLRNSAGLKLGQRVTSAQLVTLSILYWVLFIFPLRRRRSILMIRTAVIPAGATELSSGALSASARSRRLFLASHP